jgi:hypothetical protein
MNTKRSHPPALALWFLRRLCPKRNRETITGDLIESFREGRSVGWFWRQVLVAILVGASSQARLHWTEICFAAAGTALTRIRWEKLIPISALTGWGVGLRWPLDAPFLALGMSSGAGIVYTLSVFEIATALMVLPLLAVFSYLWKTSGWLNLLRVYFICVTLFIAGDLPILWWDVSHVISRSHPPIGHATWAIARAGWIFAALLISARIARRSPSSAKTIPA